MNLKGEDLVSAQEYIVSLKRFLHIGRVVLTGHSHKNPPVRKGREKVLIKSVQVLVLGQVPANAFRTNFTHDAGPDSIIQIRDDSFFASRGNQEPRTESCQRVGVRERVGKSN